jgi:hypothetical protein
VIGAYELESYSNPIPILTRSAKTKICAGLSNPDSDTLSQNHDLCRVGRAAAQEPPARRCPWQSRTWRAAANPATASHCHQTGGQPPPRPSSAQASRTVAEALPVKGGGGQRREKGPAAVPRTCTSTSHRHRDRRRAARPGPAGSGRLATGPAPACTATFKTVEEGMNGGEGPVEATPFDSETTKEGQDGVERMTERHPCLFGLS